MIMNTQSIRRALTGLYAVGIICEFIVLAGCGAHKPDDGARANTTPAGSKIEIHPVTVAVIPRTLDATGTVFPELETDIATRTMGRVDRVLVKEGDIVRRGQTVITLDSKDLDAAVPPDPAYRGSGYRRRSRDIIRPGIPGTCDLIDGRRDRVDPDIASSRANPLLFCASQRSSGLLQHASRCGEQFCKVNLLLC
jgi:hypothetical protein